MSMKGWRWLSLAIVVGALILLGPYVWKFDHAARAPPTTVPHRKPAPVEGSAHCEDQRRRD